MTDTYIKARNWGAMRAFLVKDKEGALIPEANFRDVIEPKKGTAAVPANGVEGDVDYQPAIEARGEAGCWYACIRMDEEIELSVGIELCDVAEASQVCGVFL